MSPAQSAGKSDVVLQLQCSWSHRVARKVPESRTWATRVPANGTGGTRHRRPEARPVRGPRPCMQCMSPEKIRIQGANNQWILERHGIGFAKRFRGYGYLAFAKDRRTISCAQLKFFQKPDRCVDDGVTTRNRKTCRRAKALITFRASVKA